MIHELSGSRYACLPVGDSRKDLGLNVLLNVAPLLALDGSFTGQQLAEVAWLD